MSFLSSIGRAISNPFVREVASGLAGIIGGPGAATFVNKGFTLFDGLKSAFEATKSATPFSTGYNAGSLQDPRSYWNTSRSYSTDGRGVIGGANRSDVQNAVNNDVASAFGSGGYGLTGDQRQMLLDAGLKPGSQEWKQQELQLKIANYKNMMELVSNIGKMLTDLSNRIIGNIRS